MSWSKLDDSLSDHPKAIEAGPALALWTRALAWCARHHTDGRIPKRVAEAFAACLAADPFVAASSAQLVDRLVSVGLWELLEDGWQVHDYCHYHESRLDWLARSATERDRKRRERGVSGRTDGGQPPDSGRTDAGQISDPTRARTRARASESESESESEIRDPSPGGGGNRDPLLAVLLEHLDHPEDAAGLSSLLTDTYRHLDLVAEVKAAALRLHGKGRKLDGAYLQRSCARSEADRQAKPKPEGDYADRLARRLASEREERNEQSKRAASFARGAGPPRRIGEE